MNSIQQICTPVSQEMELCRQRFDAFMTHGNPLLNEALTHVASRKGKMMRPLLTFLSAKIFGEICENTMLTALTFEFFHTASLIHDDIVDESELRRGKPSTQSVYGNKVAVLVGDFILANALEAVSLTNNPRLVHLLSQTAKQLAHGELLQLSNIQNSDFTAETYYKIIENKTAALFAACAEAGATTTTNDVEFIRLMHNFGRYVGICFQIRDDIFDYVAGDEIGKPVGNDMREGKLTLPLLHALNVTKDAEMLHLAHKVKQGEASENDISTLVKFTVDNGGIEYAEQAMGQFAKQAMEQLMTFRKTPVTTALGDYVQYVCQRQF